MKPETVLVSAMSRSHVNKLRRAAFYFPLPQVYSPKIDLWRPLKADILGNGKADARYFQIDNQYDRIRQDKLRVRAAAMAAHIGQLVSDNPLQRRRMEAALDAAAGFVTEQLCREYPDHFQMQRSNGNTLSCRLAASLPAQDEDGPQRHIAPSPHPETVNLSAAAQQLDQAGMLISEDLAVLQETENGNAVTFVHVLAPSGWNPSAAIGRSFADIHAIVPNFSRSAAAGQTAFLDRMISATSGLQRFIWGLQPNSRRNRHPTASVQLAINAQEQKSGGAAPSAEVADVFESGGETTDAWHDHPGKYRLRVERQVCQGFPEHRALLFLIRLYQIPLAEIAQNHAQRTTLLSALQNMDNDVAAYKGLTTVRERLICWLQKSSTCDAQ